MIFHENTEGRSYLWVAKEDGLSVGLLDLSCLHDIQT